MRNESELTLRCRYGCIRRFETADAHRQHERRHNRPFICPYGDCEWHWMGFPSQRDLQRHVDCHDPNRYHLCPICHRRYSRADNRDKHMREKHFGPDASIGEDPPSTPMRQLSDLPQPFGPPTVTWPQEPTSSTDAHQLDSRPQGISHRPAYEGTASDFEQSRINVNDTPVRPVGTHDLNPRTNPGVRLLPYELSPSTMGAWASHEDGVGDYMAPAGSSGLPLFWPQSVNRQLVPRAGPHTTGVDDFYAGQALTPISRTPRSSIRGYSRSRYSRRATRGTTSSRAFKGALGQIDINSLQVPQAQARTATSRTSFTSESLNVPIKNHGTAASDPLPGHNESIRSSTRSVIADMADMDFAHQPLFSDNDLSFQSTTLADEYEAQVARRYLLKWIKQPGGVLGALLRLGITLENEPQTNAAPQQPISRPSATPAMAPALQGEQRALCEGDTSLVSGALGSSDDRTHTNLDHGSSDNTQGYDPLMNLLSFEDDEAFAQDGSSFEIAGKRNKRRKS